MFGKTLDDWPNGSLSPLNPKGSQESKTYCFPWGQSLSVSISHLLAENEKAQNKLL